MSDASTPRRIAGAMASGLLIVVAGCGGGGGGTSSTTAPAVARFAYVANRVPDSVSVFAVDQASGGLTPVGAPVFVAGTVPISVTTTR